jgi:hypothetical protein
MEVANGNRYMEAAKLNKSLGKHEDALRCAERGLQIDKDCLGFDHPLYQESIEFVQEIKCMT